MNLNKKIHLLFLFFPAILLAQGNGDKLLRFKVVADSVSTAGINVVNLVNEKSAMTDGNGEFSILAKAGDLLFLQSENFEVKRKLVEEEDLKSVKITIRMIPKANQLDEVIVTRKDRSDDLIMHHKDKRDYTPAERKLYTAQTGPVDILANLFSGRTAMLKKELRVEMNERLLSRTEIQFEDQYYTETLKIPVDYIKGFQYYIIEDAEFVAALKAKNKTMMRFQMARLAVKYNELIKNQ